VSCRFLRDQFEIAKRVVAEAGASLPARRLGAGRLRSAVRDAIAHESGGARVAEAFAAAGGPAAAASELERLLSR
jgi:UDP:flavonoid glycosyltransferase YjiC (YdhE family)